MQEAGYRITQIQDEMVPLAGGIQAASEPMVFWMMAAVLLLLAVTGILLYHVQKQQRRAELAEEEQILKGLEILEPCGK